TAQQTRFKTKIKARLRMQGVNVTGERLFSATGRKEVLARVESRDLRTAITQLYSVLDQSVESQTKARWLMLRAAQAFPEIKLFRTAPGVGPIGACRFSAYVHTPSRFSTTRKLWKYCRLSVSHRSSNGKPLRRPRLDRSGCGRLKDVSRKPSTWPCGRARTMASSALITGRLSRRTRPLMRGSRCSARLSRRCARCG